MSFSRENNSLKLKKYFSRKFPGSFSRMETLLTYYALFYTTVKKIHYCYCCFCVDKKRESKVCWGENKSVKSATLKKRKIVLKSKQASAKLVFYNGCLRIDVFLVGSSKQTKNALRL